MTTRIGKKCASEWIQRVPLSAAADAASRPTAAPVRRKMRPTGFRRLGAAAVEMAVVMPLLLTMVFGIIEFGWVFTIRQALTNAAREGARTAALPGSSDTDIRARVQDYLRPLGMTTEKIDLVRATAQDPTERVHVHIKYSDVTLIGSYFGTTNYDLGSTSSMRKEGLD